MPLVVFGQLDISTGGNFSDPDWLANEVLAGKGVTISNVRSYGYAEQFGYFENGKDIVEMASGVVMSNGSVPNIFPQDKRMNKTYDVSVDGGLGDDDLLTIANEVPALVNKSFTVAKTADAAIIEFDFVSVSDSVEFSFVFASEEYSSPEDAGYLFSKYNDVFGFFVAGPGISGPYSSPSEFTNGSANLATIPENNWPITVSTVNDQFNSGYFNHSSNGASPNPFNGQTFLITRTFRVEPCEVYHFRFAIADGQDNSHDSAVFLEEGSFKIKRDVIEFPNEEQLGGNLYEGCSDLELVFNLPAALDIEQEVAVNFLAGSEADGTDFLGWQNKLLFEEGVRTKSFSIPVVLDGAAEGVEKLLLEFVFEEGCITPIVSPDLQVNDYEKLEPNIVQDPPELDCPNVPFQLIASPTGGLGNKSIQWIVGGTNRGGDTVLMLTDFLDTPIQIELRDECLLVPDTLTYEPSIRPGSIPTIDSLADVFMCVMDTVAVSAVTTGGYGAVEVTWEPLAVTGSDIVLQKDVVEQVVSQVEVTAAVTDECGLGENVKFLLEVVNPKANFDYEFYNGFTLFAENSSTGTYSDIYWKLDGEIVGEGQERIQHRLETLKNLELELILLDTASNCEDRHSEVLEFPVKVYVPNAFSPNDDGFNDEFQVVSDQQFDQFHLTIFNRYGEVVFESRDQTETWNGDASGDSEESAQFFIWKLNIGIGDDFQKELTGSLTVIK